jgi:sRNA-binding carbon storage regulator CsrA
LGSIMEILARQQGETVVCELPNGDSIEITMVSTQGEDSRSIANVKDAVKLLRQNPHLLTSAT